jgi:RNA polymerase sigma factor (sigma-70 family)
VERSGVVTSFVGPLEGDGGDGQEPDPQVLPWVESFETFYARELPSLVALAHALTGRAHAEDIAQEALIIAYRHWSDVSAMDHPSAWVRRVCANLATSVVRRKVIETRALVRLRGGQRPAEDIDQEAADFWAAVRRLPRRQAQAVALYYFYGASVAEASAAMDCREGTVKKHLARGRTKLASTLGLELDEVGADEA